MRQARAAVRRLGLRRLIPNRDRDDALMPGYQTRIPVRLVKEVECPALRGVFQEIRIFRAGISREVHFDRAADFCAAILE